MPEDKVLSPEEQERLKRVIDYSLERLETAKEKVFHLSVYKTKGESKIQLLQEDISAIWSELQHIRRSITGLSSYEEPNYEGPKP